MPDDHFLDTNIIIGYTVNWDRQFPSIQNYVSAIRGNTSIYSSERVLSESEKTVSKRRRLTKQAAKSIFDDFSGRRPIADQDIIDFVYRELNQYSENAVDHVLQFIQEEMSIFKGLVDTDSENALRLTIEDIDSEFSTPLNLIDDIRREVHQGLEVAIQNWGDPDYDSIYSEYGSMRSLLPDSPMDRDILFDAYHLCEQDNISPLSFITMDRSDILSNRQTIHSLLSGIVIHHPGEV